MAVLWRQTLWYNPSFVPTPIVTNTPVQALEMAGIPFETFGTGTLTITATVTSEHTVNQPPAALSMYLVAPGADVTNPASFASNPALFVADESGWPFPTSFNTFTMKDGSNSFKNIIGPNTPQSIYIWPAANPGSYRIRRVYVVVEGDYPTPTSSDQRIWNGTLTGVDDPSVACSGTFVGQILVEGSLDGVNFSPIGSFSSAAAARGGSPAFALFDPLLVSDVRYVRVNVPPGTQILDSTSITIGGPQNCSC